MKEVRGLRLDPLFAEALTNLRIATRVGEGSEEQKLEAYLAQRPHERAVLVDNLTRSIADIAYRIEHERHLRALKIAEVCDDAFFTDEDRQSRILQNGPDILRNDELGHAVLSFSISSWTEKIAELVSPFWIEAVEAALSQGAREKGELRKRTEDLLAEILDDAESDEE